MKTRILFILISVCLILAACKADNTIIESSDFSQEQSDVSQGFDDKIITKDYISTVLQQAKEQYANTDDLEKLNKDNYWYLRTTLYGYKFDEWYSVITHLVIKELTKTFPDTRYVYTHDTGIKNLSGLWIRNEFIIFLTPEVEEKYGSAYSCIQACMFKDYSGVPTDKLEEAKAVAESIGYIVTAKSSMPYIRICSGYILLVNTDGTEETLFSHSNEDDFVERKQ